MDSSELQALAKEREARRGQPMCAPPGATGVPLPIPETWRAKPKPSPTSDGLHTLIGAHRSIKLARSFGFASAAVGMLLLLFGAGRMTVLLFVLGGIGLARGGAALMHGLMPGMLIESPRPPTPDEMARASAVGIFSLEGVKTFGVSLGAEYMLALDSLAWCSTTRCTPASSRLERSPRSCGASFAKVSFAAECWVPQRAEKGQRCTEHTPCGDMPPLFAVRKLRPPGRT